MIDLLILAAILVPVIVGFAVFVLGIRSLRHGHRPFDQERDL